jgi:hypothetical protein
MMNTAISYSLKDLTQHDWLTFGLNAIAYLRPAVVNGQSIYAIHAADGSQLALVANRDIGLAAMYEHELEPVWLQ